MSQHGSLQPQGSPSALPEAKVEGFASSLRGSLIRPSDKEYETARRVFNGMIDKRPNFIARCAGAADVVTCVNFAREHTMRVAVRGCGP